MKYPLAALLAGALLGLFAASTKPAFAQWAPTERVNYVIGVAPGGTVDLYARGIQKALESLHLTNGQLVLAYNKPGAGGAIAMQELESKAGNAHYLGTFHTGAIAGAVTGLIRADPRTFVPVAMMVEETSLVAVRSNSALNDAHDLVAALRADPGKLRVAVAPALGQNTHMGIAKPLKAAGVAIEQMTVVAFRSSGDSVMALLGGHVDVVSATAPVILPHVASGKLRIVASAAPVPGTGPLAGVKTWRQQGVPADYVSYNGVMLPPGVNAEQIRFWESALRRVSEDPAWIALVERSGNKPIFRGYVDSHRYLQSEWKSSAELAAQLNLGARR
ncbi:MAG: tripartite tricarboxylate transporter substrate binding protein [Burkholderiaceae bacterium]|nr:tripartite tricarboxylate transporter substrate binding protein [Burkholderiaceae bacterium]